MNTLRGSSPRSASVGSRGTFRGLRRFTFARNDLLFTMSDNTRMQAARGRDALHARIHFHGRVWRSIKSPPSLRASAGNLRGSKAGLPTEAAVAAKVGGARRDRTDDLLLAKQALSQLSYGPFSAAHSIRGALAKTAWLACRAVARGSQPTSTLWASARQPSHRFASEGWWAWEDLNFRPHAYQARALTN